MYESPVGLFYQETAPKISEGIDSLICEAVLNVGVNVDKEELLKALKYDRGQYEKGYADGIARTTPQGHWEVLWDVYNHCSICGFKTVYASFNFCPNCGAQMIGGEDHD